MKKIVKPLLLTNEILRVIWQDERFSLLGSFVMDMHLKGIVEHLGVYYTTISRTHRSKDKKLNVVGDYRN